MMIVGNGALAVPPLGIRCLYEWNAGGGVPYDPFHVTYRVSHGQPMAVPTKTTTREHITCIA